MSYYDYLKKKPIHTTAVGAYVLVAGGTCGLLDDDPCAVEIHRVDGVATACEPLPDAFRGSASATFLSVAASDKKMYVMERSTGLICSFDVESGAWGRPALLRPDASLFSCCISFSGGRLILAGLGRDGENTVTLNLWAVDCESSFECEEIGGMPEEMLDRLSGGDVSSSLSSVDISVVGDFAYVCKASDPAMFFSCDFAGGECMWTEVGAPAGMGENPAVRYAFTCSEVRMDDLRRAFWPAEGERGRRRE
ncbi:hypothetical protein Taro_025105 [Colocasia esculenta]|uniref:Uncharacterized protein n=1 Tax=Colocasia esculenta TaxID=4460 RepID=A0A843V9B1_COLES|nr:hypothetical protein [Colocasia esculenta]